MRRSGTAWGPTVRLVARSSPCRSAAAHHSRLAGRIQRCAVAPRRLALAAAAPQKPGSHRGDPGQRDLRDRVVERAAGPALAEQLLEDAGVLLVDLRGRLREPARI